MGRFRRLGGGREDPRSIAPGSGSRPAAPDESGASALTGLVEPGVGHR